MDWSKWGMEAKVLLNGLVRAGWGEPMVRFYSSLIKLWFKRLSSMCVFTSICWTVFSCLIVQRKCKQTAVQNIHTFASQSWKHFSLPWHCNDRKSVDSESNYFPRKVSLKASYLLSVTATYYNIVLHRSRRIGVSWNIYPRSSCSNCSKVTLCVSCSAFNHLTVYSTASKF